VTSRFFSDKHRPVHLGPYPLERLQRQARTSYSDIPSLPGVEFDRSEAPHSIVNAMREFQAMLDAIREGFTNTAPSACPEDPRERSEHLKAFAYFNDASMVGVSTIPTEARLEKSLRNPDIDTLASDLRTRQTTTLAAGIDQIMAGLKESMDAPPSSIEKHTHAMVYLYEYPRDPGVDEAGSEWIQNAQAERACLRASETATIIANYLRLLGFSARAHSSTTSDVDLGVLCVAAGLASVEAGALHNPYVGSRFGVAAVTTSMDVEVDLPLVDSAQQPARKTHGLAWKVGYGFAKSAHNQELYAKRRYVDGPHPFEKLKRVKLPTTYMDEENIPRVPKRTDMFARAQFGDMGKTNQQAATAGYYVRKAAPSSAQRRALGALVLLQDGESNTEKVAPEPKRHAELIKATAYFLGVDAVGISRCPPWAWYSHNALGEPIEPPHDQAISMIIDQGFETMEGASGDDWISVAQSMRAYLRFSLLGSVIAKQIRRLGYKAKSHSVLDGEVLQPPLLLLSGLGEVSRIGEVILNPFLGPRLKSGVITTDLPLAHDQPIDFGLQAFCEQCNKCARECPSGAITAGPKLMFNGYEIWKSDSQKCASYRVTTKGGAMCGRCMKTCPWNLEGLFAEKPFRWAAMNFPSTAKALAKLDDVTNRGSLNPIKRWWWDLELDDKGGYQATKHPVNERKLQKDLHLKYEDQTLAVYPAPLAPHPWPYPFPMDREKGIEAYQAMVTAEQYKISINAGRSDDVVHKYQYDTDAPVVRVKIDKAVAMGDSVSRYVLKSLDGSELPTWSAGAHLDIVVAPEYLRQYSMSGNPADRSYYEIGVLREDEGRGGSKLLHRIFSENRRIFISKPINHFPQVLDARKSWLMGGGIGITPMIAMAHEAHTRGLEFELHYSISSRHDAGYLAELDAVPWSDNVYLHVSYEGSRADLDKVLSAYQQGHHVYTCGPAAYMDAVTEAAVDAGFPTDAQHVEYFEVPELPDYVNHPFKVKLRQSGQTFDVPDDKSATDVLTEAGISIDVKCSDGLCGVCKCSLVAGEVEHRDFVLSAEQRKTSIILCQSRAATANATIEVDLD